MFDFATFIFTAASLLSRARSAARGRDGDAVREAVFALRDASDKAHATRMVALCDAMYRALPPFLTDDVQDEIEALIAAIADELDQVTGELQVSHIA